jgi:hypothetical protein
MGYFPFGFKPIEPTTWAYLSSLLMLALFFKFNRFWSFRNFDLILVILLTPGLLMVHYGSQRQARLNQAAMIGNSIVQQENGDSLTQTEPASEPQELAGAEELQPQESAKAETPVDEGERPLTVWQELQRYGYLWLFVVELLWLVRLLNDSLLVRKPMLEPNLSVGGLVFLACSLAIFLFANVLTSQPADLAGPEGAVNLVKRNAREAGDQLQKYGPGYPLLHIIPTIQTFVDRGEIGGAEDQDTAAAPRQTELVEVARIMAILSQIAIVAGLIYVGYAHFGNFQMGMAMAVIFLMLPYTAQFAGDSMHLLPAALLVWAIASYDRPFVDGVLIGAAAGVCYYPLFLLPRWISYYWERGRTEFVMGAGLAIALVISSLSLTSTDVSGFLAQLQSIFGFIWPRSEGLGGIWALNWESWFRLPLLVGYVVLCISYAFWPTTKDLGVLISCTAAAMVAVQFWHGDGGGRYLAWFMPLALMIIFRPNLDHKQAVAVLEEKPRHRDSEDGSGAGFGTHDPEPPLRQANGAGRHGR